jgi:hypothetical protein
MLIPLANFFVQGNSFCSTVSSFIISSFSSSNDFFGGLITALGVSLISWTFTN